MKARLLAGCPHATLVDVSHSIAAFDVYAGAFVLWAGTRDFPPGSVHLAVVDPGVGGRRPPPALPIDGSSVVGPHNGLVGLVLQGAQDAGAMAVAVDVRLAARPSTNLQR